MNDWPRIMGDKRRQRDEVAAVNAQALTDSNDERRRTSLRRWPGIVAAIRTLIARYNGGAGADALVLTEEADSERPSVTLQSSGARRGALTVTVDGAELYVATRDADVTVIDCGRWVDLTRSDEDTAAYVLQNWMERV